MRAFPLLSAVLAALAVTACDPGDGADEAREPDTSEAAAPTEPSDAASDAPTPQEEGETTPMEERVATIGLLNKRNNVSRDLMMRPGDVVEEGPVIVTLAACERTAPYEFPQETGAFVQVDILDRGASDHARVFSGWLFKESPSLNVVEHPIYDVWVKDCAMSFPGDE